MRNGYTECSLPERTCCRMTSNGQMIVVKKANFTKSMNSMLCLLAQSWDYLPCYVLCVGCFPWRRIYTKRLEVRVIYIIWRAICSNITFPHLTTHYDISCVEMTWNRSKGVEISNAISSCHVIISRNKMVVMAIPCNAKLVMAYAM